MSTNSAIFGLSWDFAAVRSADQSQRWVLSAMQNHGPGLVTMLWRILGNEQDLCDAYQQTFLQLAHYEGRQKPDNVQAYLFRTAANTAISMLRQKKVRLKYKEAFESATGSPFRAMSWEHRPWALGTFFAYLVTTRNWAITPMPKESMT